MLVQEQQEQQAKLNLRNGQLLVVDDEENVTKAIRRQLHKTFNVHIAKSADEAYKILDDNAIDVVLSDQRMPDTTGVEFLAKVRQDYPDIIRLLLTGYADIKVVISAINTGRVEQYIQKPWDAGELERIITESYELKTLKTENERLASELASALEAEKRFSQLQSDFITLISHEFRTPLTVIMFSAETLRTLRLKLEPERIEKKLDQIIDQVEHMKYLMEEVSAIGNRHPFQPEAIDICEQVQICINLIKQSLSSKHTIVADIPEHCASFVGDARIIRELVTELFTNAVKFSTEAGTITCKLIVDSARAEITISDEGRGILPQDIDQVFMPFVKGENAGNIHGIGLGLAIVRHAVNLHQGQIFVESNNTKGTTVRVVLSSLSEMIDH